MVFHIEQIYDMNLSGRFKLDYIIEHGSVHFCPDWKIMMVMSKKTL